MKIEFRKIPLQGSEFDISSDSVKFSGIFSKISSTIAKVDATITGKMTVDCCRCGDEMLISLEEKSEFLVSDGLYKQDQDSENELIVVEVENHTVDFDELLQGEMESVRSDFHICEKCENNDYLEIEY